jgi:hypothetical protein
VNKRRSKEFKGSNPAPSASRAVKFSVRQRHFKQIEEPSIATWQRPGRGPNGEHQN